MLKLFKILFAGLLLASTAHAFSVSPPTVFQSWSDPLTVNEQMASVTVNTIGLNRLKLSEAPGSSADVTVEFFLEDGTTSVQRIAFANDDTTADIDSQIQVITKKAVIYITPRVTQTYTAAVYGVAGGDTNTANNDASILTVGTLPESAFPSTVVTDNFTNPVSLNAGLYTTSIQANSVSSDYVTANRIESQEVSFDTALLNTVSSTFNISAGSITYVVTANGITHFMDNVASMNFIRSGGTSYFPNGMGTITTDLKIDLPGDGTYHIVANLRMVHLGTSSVYGAVRLFNSTTSAAIEDTERMCFESQSGTLGFVNIGVSFDWYVSVGGPTTILLQGSENATDVVGIVSDSNGYNTIGYVRLN